MLELFPTVYATPLCGLLFFFKLALRVCGRRDVGEEELGRAGAALSGKGQDPGLCPGLLGALGQPPLLSGREPDTCRCVLAEAGNGVCRVPPEHIRASSF